MKFSRTSKVVMGILIGVLVLGGIIAYLALKPQPRLAQVPVTVGKESINVEEVKYTHLNYLIWKELKVRDRILVYLGSDFNARRISPNAMKEIVKIDHAKIKRMLRQQKREETVGDLNSTNYIYAGFADKRVRYLYWVVPDSYWEVVRETASAYSGLEVGDQFVKGKAYGHPFAICTLENLPEIGEPVMLDVNVSYFLTYPRKELYRMGCESCKSKRPFKREREGLIPWILPPDVIGGLQSKGIQTDLVVVSYAVEANYIPNPFRALGYEFKDRLEGKLTR